MRATNVGIRNLTNNEYRLFLALIFATLSNIFSEYMMAYSENIIPTAKGLKGSLDSQISHFRHMTMGISLKKIMSLQTERPSFKHSKTKKSLKLSHQN